MIGARGEANKADSVLWEEGSNASLSGRSKTRTNDKYRVVYSDHQRLELEREFHFSKYITIRRKAELAQALELSERQVRTIDHDDAHVELNALSSHLQVKIWFQNRRAKDRKQIKKRDEVFEREKHEMAANINAAAAAQMFGMPPSHHLLHGEHHAPLPPPPFNVGT